MLIIPNETLNINCNPNDNVTHTTRLMLMEKDGKLLERSLEKSKEQMS